MEWPNPTPENRTADSVTNYFWNILLDNMKSIKLAKATKSRKNVNFIWIIKLEIIKGLFLLVLINVSEKEAHAAVSKLHKRSC